MGSLESLFQVFRSRKMAALSLLGLSSGLPFLLTSDLLKAWLTEANIDLTLIGLFSVVAIPYSFKFLWAPLLDRFVPPFLGRRRGWLAIAQVALVLSIIWLAFQDPTQLKAFSSSAIGSCPTPLETDPNQPFTWFQAFGRSFEIGWCQFLQALQTLSGSALFWAALLVAFFSATQDINTDAYRTDILKPSEMGAGAAIFVLGYRIALLLTGWLAFTLAQQFGNWRPVFLCLAAVMSLGLLATLFAPAPIDEQRPTSLTEAVIRPFQEFIQRLGLRTAILSLLFIVLFKFGDTLVNSMAVPFLVQTGFAKAQIGAIRGGIGLIATIIGTLAGGTALSKIGIAKSLWIFGGIQALSNLAYYWLAIVGKNEQLMLLTINIENFSAGLGTAAFVAFLMSLCNARFSATQYALLSSFMAVSRDLLVTPAGGWAKNLGWPTFFLISTIAALPGLLLLPFFAPWNSKVSAEVEAAEEQEVH